MMSIYSKDTVSKEENIQLILKLTVATCEEYEPNTMAARQKSHVLVNQA